MTDFELDWERERRTGIAEAILCDSKSALQIEAILQASSQRRLLLTRLCPTMFAMLPEALQALLDFDPLSRTAVLGGAIAIDRVGVGIVCAGTSDLPVAREAARTLGFNGFAAPIIADVGVAGLWRLLRRVDDLRRHAVLIAVAGMEGALFSVLGGLVEAPVIAVPTSIGYGIAAGGSVALGAALASCSPGLVVVNTDNGFGAACAAMKMLRLADRRPTAAR